MPDTPYRPVGFCPRCGYAIDPGECPECGQLVPPKRIAKSPPALRRRRLLARATFLAAFAAIAYAGLAVIKNELWVRAIPLPLLLHWQSRLPGEQLFRPGSNYVPDFVIDREICRRHRSSSDKLPRDQLARIFRQAIADAPELGLPPRFPAHIPVELRLNIRTTQLMPVIFVCGDGADLEVQGQLTLDGAVIDGDIHQSESSGSCEPRAFSMLLNPSISIPALSPGTHRLELRAEIRAHHWEELATTVTRGQTVVVEDLPLDFFVASIRDDATLSAVSRHAFVRAFRHKAPHADTPSLNFQLILDTLPVPLIARAQIRRSGSDEWNDVGDLVAADADQVHWTPYYVGCRRELCDWRQIDIRLVPAPLEAWGRKHATCFGGAVEWLSLPIHDEPEWLGDAESFSFEDRFPDAVLPTRVE